MFYEQHLKAILLVYHVDVLDAESAFWDICLFEVINSHCTGSFRHREDTLFFIPVHPTTKRLVTQRLLS